MTQPEAMNRAIKLALRLECAGQNEAAAELRRLHELNQELLVALKDLINCADTNRDWAELKAARAAIAKAEGVKK
jgi:hypothetical protein